MATSGLPGQAKVSAMLLRDWLGVLRRMDLLEAITPKLSSEARAVVARPPLPIAWVDAKLFEEIVSAAGEASDRETIRRCAFENTRQRAGPLVMPMLRTLLKLWSATPSTLFGNMSNAVGVQVKGTKLAYRPETETSGTVEIDPARVTSDWVYAAWEGVLMYAYEVAGVEGEVDRAELADGGRKARVAVRWGPRLKA